jgi:hypothetical protein
MEVLLCKGVGLEYGDFVSDRLGLNRPCSGDLERISGGGRGGGRDSIMTSISD